MTKTNKEIMEFKLFLNTSLGNVKTGHYCDILDDNGYKLLIKAVKQALSSQRTELIKKIEGMKYFIPVSKELTILEYRREMKGYERALEDIKEFLTKWK